MDAVFTEAVATRGLHWHPESQEADGALILLFQIWDKLVIITLRLCEREEECECNENENYDDENKGRMRKEKNKRK